MTKTQKFYDDLDNAVFESQGETIIEDKPLIVGSEEGRVRIGSTFNTSSGTSEVHINSFQKLDPNTRLLLLYITIVQFYIFGPGYYLCCTLLEAEEEFRF